MDNIMRIALIPAYEPEAVMVETAAGLKNSGFTVIIVDDGSGSKYSELFDSAEEYAHIIHYQDNRGKGSALKTGLQYISDVYNGPYTVVTVDADGQHKVSDVIRVCYAAEQNRTALTLGSRRFDGNVPLRSRFGNSVTRFVFRLSSEKKIYDTQTG